MFTKIRIVSSNSFFPKDVGLNQCPGCGQVFKSLTAFEAHRLGEHGTNRHCGSLEKLKALGMSQNAKGWWVTAEFEDSARIALE
jgi:hypothetical protein